MNRVNLIPMAGEGQRFINSGYKTPKPLIDIDGVPMVVHAAKSLPKADKWIFICRKQHIAEKNIDYILTNYFPNAIVLSVDYLTNGQASTCLLAREYLEFDDQLTIGACDNSMVYDKDKFGESMRDNDALIWTFRNNHTVLQCPEMYGWVNINESGKATGVSCKIPISNNPLNDHAIVGAFSFKKAELFFKYTDKMMKKNRKINNEFYLDIVLDELIIDKYNVHPFEVSKYTCWGTPEDLEKYKELKHE